MRGKVLKSCAALAIGVMLLAVNTHFTEAQAAKTEGAQAESPQP